jgi:signal transduction histidine kinase
VWFGTPTGVAGLSGSQWRAYTNRQGLPEGNVNCLAAGSGGVLWVGTSKGLAFIRSGIAHAPRAVPDLLREPILGIDEDKTGRLWIETENRVLRVNLSELMAENLGDEGIRGYGLADGLRSSEGIGRDRSVITDPIGRIWFATNGGLSFVDPNRVSGLSIPAIVSIDAVSADGRAVGLSAGEVIRIPTPHQRVTIRFSGLSLSVPSRVRFRFRLDNFDHDWSEPVAEPVAAYTNLGAGSYRFRVIASNSDGVWNSSETSTQLFIEPLLWQTWWFQLACVLALGMAVAGYLRLRTLQLTRQLNMRFEERLAERTRIAQDLHDTLLQGFLSASMQLHVANEYLERDSPAKQLLTRVLELMGQVIEEGRTTVGALRSSASSSMNLEQAFSRVKQEFAGQENVDFHVIAEGAMRPLHPLIRDEIYRIGREALINAFRHSRASRIEVELEYASDKFRVLVRDNGVGINAEVLKAGRDGHWGLSGMRERAKKIGARLRVLSSADAGTEVELSIPGHTAFEH